MSKLETTAQEKLDRAVKNMPAGTQEYLRELNERLGEIHRKMEACSTEERRAMRRIEESPEHQRLMKARAKKQMLKAALRDTHKLAEGAFVAAMREQGVTEDVTALIVDGIPTPSRLLEAAPANEKGGRRG